MPLFMFPLHPDSIGGSSTQVLWQTCKAAAAHSLPPCPGVHFSKSNRVLRCTVHNQINRIPSCARTYQTTSPGAHPSGTNRVLWHTCTGMPCPDPALAVDNQNNRVRLCLQEHQAVSPEAHSTRHSNMCTLGCPT